MGDMEEQSQEEKSAITEPAAQEPLASEPPQAPVEDTTVEAPAETVAPPVVESGEHVEKVEPIDSIAPPVAGLQNDRIGDPQVADTPPDPSQEGISVESPPAEGNQGVGAAHEERVKAVEKIVERVVEKPIEVIKEIKVFDEARAQEEAKSRLIGFRAAALRARQRKRDEKLEKIMAFARERGRVTNDEAQVLIGATNRSAARYLMLLVWQGRLKKAGMGRGAHYVF